VVIARYHDDLRAAGLDNLDRIRAYRPQHLIKNHRGHRDISRIDLPLAGGGQTTLFLKRNFHSPLKNGIRSLVTRGRVWSVSREEWENCRALQEAGIRTCDLVAFGEDCGPIGERFSFILTEAAAGDSSVDEFFAACGDAGRRAAVVQALAREIRRMHDAGLFTPDLFARHIFVAMSPPDIRFCFIDMARLDRRADAPARLRARDLAALNASVPMKHASARQRLRFLIAYDASNARSLVGRVRRRFTRLLRRAKFASFYD
jgi:tRNA A-37 threonylcarbamoyl transferase component Bud32